MSNRYLPLALLCVAGILGAEPKRDRFGDPLPEGAVARLGSMRFRQGSSVVVGDFSPDGKILATHSWGRVLTFWDTISGRELRSVLSSLSGSLRYVRFSADGKSLILAGDSSDFRVIDTVTGAERRKLELPKREYPYNDLRGVAIAGNGNTAVTLYTGGTLVVWDLAESKRRGEFHLQTDIERFSHNPIALTPDGKQVVLPHKDGSLHLLDVTTGKEVLAFEMPSDKPRNYSPIVTISPDGRYLAFGGSSARTSASPCNSIVLCDMTTGKRLRELSSKERINEWVFTPNSRSLAVSSAEIIRFFDVASGKETKTLRKPWGWGLVFSPDGRKLAVAAGTCILLWDVEAGRLLHSPVGHDWFLREFHFSPDGKRLVSNTSRDLIVWDVATSRPLASLRTGKLQQWISLPAKGEAVRFLDWKQRPSPTPRRGKERGLDEKGLDGEKEAPPSGMETHQIQRWNLTADRVEPEFNFSIPAAYDWFVVSPDGGRVAVITLGGEPKISLGSLKGGKPAVPAALPDDSRVVQVEFSSDGRRLLVSSWYGALRVLDGITGQRVRDLVPSASRRRFSSKAAFAEDGRSVALYDGQLCIREVASGKDRLQLPLAGQPANLTFSPNGRFLAGNSQNNNDGSIRVFSTATGKLLARWRRNQGNTTALAYSPDSRLLVTGDYDGTILLWKLPEDDGLPATLSKEEAATFWQALAGDDAARANRALGGLAAAPAQAVPLIKERFPIVWKKPDAKHIARRIAELDDDAFKVRERAVSELAEAGPDAIEALRAALTAAPSAEAKKRIEGLLHRADKGTPQQLRALRAIEVLERIGTPAAREVLRELSRQTLTIELQREIEASLRRLKGRGQAEPGRLQTP